MGALFPWFLAGAAMVVVPLLLHFRNKHTKEVKEFSSLMFLEASRIRDKKKSRIRHWLLLLCRCAIVALFALAFARPFFKGDALPQLVGEAAERVVILVDGSASMQREDLWSRAIEEAQAVVDGVGEADQVHIGVFDAGVRTLMSFEDWKATLAGERRATARERLGAAKPTWRETGLGSALVAASEALDEFETMSGEVGEDAERIVVISDLQAGADVTALNGFSWPEDVEVEFKEVAAKGVGNAHLALLPLAQMGGHLTSPVRKFQVTNAAESKESNFNVRWRTRDGAEASTEMAVHVPPGETRTFTAPETTGGIPAPILELAGDAQDFDNGYYVEAGMAKKVRVLYIGAEKIDDPTGGLFFLKHALIPTRFIEPDLVVKTPDLAVDAEALADFDLVVLADPLTLASGDPIREFVSSGGRVLVVMHSPQSAVKLGELLECEVACEEGAVPEYALLGNINRRHPLLGAFADARFGDFSNIHYWKYRKLDVAQIADSEVIAAYENGDPAWVLARRGDGEVLVMTSSWRKVDSEWALSTKFLPLIYAIITGESGKPRRERVRFVGDPIPMAEEGEFFEDAVAPGLYDVDEKLVAVNLNPAESAIAPLDLPQLEALVEPASANGIEGTIVADEAMEKLPPNSVEQEAKQRIWRIVLWLVVLLVLFEIWYSSHCRKREVREMETV